MGIERAEPRSGDEPMHRPCPRCSSDDTTFAYFNNGNRQQPRYRCKGCQRHWTVGGTLRTVPLGAAIRKKTKSKSMGAAANAATWSDSDHNGRADSQEPADTNGDTTATDSTPLRKATGDLKNSRAKSNCTSHPSSPSHTSSGLKPPSHNHTTRAKTAPRKESSLESAVTSCHTLAQATEKPFTNGFLNFPAGGGLLSQTSLPSLGRLLASEGQQGYTFSPPGSHNQHHKQQQAISDFVDHLDLKVEEDCEDSCGGSSLEAMILGRHNNQQQRQCNSNEPQPRLFHNRGVAALQEQGRPLLSFNSLPSLPHAGPAAGFSFSHGNAEQQQGGLHLNNPHHHQQQQDHHLDQQQQHGSGGFSAHQAGYLHQISQMMHSQHLADGSLHRQHPATGAMSGSGGSVTSGSAGSNSNHLSRLSPNNNPTFQFPNYVLPLNLASANPHSPRSQGAGAVNAHSLNPHHSAHTSSQQQQPMLGGPGPLFQQNGFGPMQGEGRFDNMRAVPPYGMMQEHQQQQPPNQPSYPFQFGQNQHFQQQQQPYHQQNQYHQQQNLDQQLFLHYQQQQHPAGNHNSQQQQAHQHANQQPPQQLQPQLSAGHMLDLLASRGGITDGGGAPPRSSNNPPAHGLFSPLSQSVIMGDSGPMPDLIDSSLIPELPSGFMGGDLSLGASISVL